MPAHSSGSADSSGSGDSSGGRKRTAGTGHGKRAAKGTAGGAAAYLSTRLLPLVVLLLLGATGTALYIGGLGSPNVHLKEFPLAVVNRDIGAQPAGGGPEENLGQSITDQLREGFSATDEFDLRELSWEEAQEQLGTGQIYAAAVIPESFSADALGLVSGALSATEVTRPSITVYSNPQAGSLASSLATSALQPALEQASTALGEQLTNAAQTAQAQAQAEQARELARLGTALPAQVEQQIAPQVDGTSADLLRSPVRVSTTPM